MTVRVGVTPSGGYGNRMFIDLQNVPRALLIQAVHGLRY